MMFSFWSERLIFGTLFLALCVKNEEITHMLTSCFHWQYFCLCVATRVQLLLEFDVFGID